VFPQKLKNATDDIADTYPVLFKITGLEEGKKYMFELKSSLHQNTRATNLSLTSPN